MCIKQSTFNLTSYKWVFIHENNSVTETVFDCSVYTTLNQTYHINISLHLCKSVLMNCLIIILMIAEKTPEVTLLYPFSKKNLIWGMLWGIWIYSIQTDPKQKKTKQKECFQPKPWGHSATTWCYVNESCMVKWQPIKNLES